MDKRQAWLCNRAEDHHRGFARKQVTFLSSVTTAQQREPAECRTWNWGTAVAASSGNPETGCGSNRSEAAIRKSRIFVLVTARPADFPPRTTTAATQQLSTPAGPQMKPNCSGWNTALGLSVLPPGQTRISLLICRKTQPYRTKYA